MSMLEVRNLSLRLGGFSFSNLNFSVREGEYCVILGPTGAGKTILLETIAGIHQPDAGTIFLHGEDVTFLPPEERKIGMVYQDYMLFSHLSVLDNIAFGLRQLGVDKKKRKSEAAKMAELLGISELLNRRPATLSGGEQQRAAIARALLMKPAILLLDEPLSALDTRTRQRLREELLRIHRETNTTILHITHHFEDMYALADSVVIMQNGNIIQQGSPEEILKTPATDFVAAFTGMENIFAGMARSKGDGVIGISIGKNILYAVSNRTGNVRAGIRPEELIVSTERFESSARNSIRGTVKTISMQGLYALITIDCEPPLTAALTKQSVQRLNIEPGSIVWVTFKASAVHVFGE